MKKTAKNATVALTGFEVKSISQPATEGRAEQARVIKASIVKELHYRESKMRFRVI